MDSIRFGRQYGVYLEPTIKGDRAAAVGPHGHGAMHRLPPHRKHHRISGARER